VETRPWAHLVRLTTGQTNPLSGDTAHVGRPTPGVEAIRHQVSLEPQRISRIHLSISRKGEVMDWRSFYGTSLNAGLLPYGRTGQLAAGDVLVLSGLEPFVYRPIDWRPWHYFDAPKVASEPPLPGWAAVVDRQRRVLLPISTDADHFIVVRDDGVEVTDQQTEDAVLIVRRRVLREHAPLSYRPMQARKRKGESTPPPPYHAIVYAAEQNFCPLQGEKPVLTLEPLPSAKDHIQSFIKEGEYELRAIVLPPAVETVFLNQSRAWHGIGEVLFRTKAGAFQVVPTRTADIVKFCGR
jgi:hypothetical protein